MNQTTAITLAQNVYVALMDCAEKQGFHRPVDLVKNKITTYQSLRKLRNGEHLSEYSLTRIALKLNQPLLYFVEISKGVRDEKGELYDNQ